MALLFGDVLVLVLNFVLQHGHLFANNKKNTLQTEQNFCPAAYLALLAGVFALNLSQTPLQHVVILQYHYLKLPYYYLIIQYEYSHIQF